MITWDKFINFFKRKKIPNKLRGAIAAPVIAEVLRCLTEISL